jgi:hypothetical protein
MSFGFGPKRYLRGAIPLYSNMVASATDLLSGGLFPFAPYLHFIAFQWECVHVWSYLIFICTFANMNTKYHSVTSF